MSERGTAWDLIVEGLKRMGADGLCTEVGPDGLFTEHCKCGLDDLIQCGCVPSACRPAEKITAKEALARGLDPKRYDCFLDDTVVFVEMELSDD